MGAAGRLPGAADGHDRRRRVRRSRPGPGQLHRRAGSRPRPGHHRARHRRTPRDPDDTGRIGRAVLAGLLPARRARYSARKVKCSTSRYHVRDQDRPELPDADHPGADHHHGPAPGPARRASPQPRRTSRPVPASPGPTPEETRSPASWPASPDTTGPDANSRPCSASSPATCSPSSPNGPAWASSPRPAAAAAAAALSSTGSVAYCSEAHGRGVRLPPPLDTAGALAGPVLAFVLLTQCPGDTTRSSPPASGSRSSGSQSSCCSCANPRRLDTKRARETRFSGRARVLFREPAVPAASSPPARC